MRIHDVYYSNLGLYRGDWCLRIWKNKVCDCSETQLNLVLRMLAVSLSVLFLTWSDHGQQGVVSAIHVSMTLGWVFSGLYTLPSIVEDKKHCYYMIKSKVHAHVTTFNFVIVKTNIWVKERWVLIPVMCECDSHVGQEQSGPQIPI